ncbi:MAG: shikimate kinase, partial [Sedimenticola sp.]
MRIFLVGVSCVGKTAIGAELSNLLDYRFFDFDEEVERFFGMPIEHLQERFEHMELFRQEASKALLHVLTRKESKNSVIALPPSGLMNSYWKVGELKLISSKFLHNIRVFDVMYSLLKYTEPS